MDEVSLMKKTEQPLGFNNFTSTDLHVKSEQNVLATNLKTYSEAKDNISRWISSSIPKSHLDVNKNDYMDFIGLWEDRNKIQMKTYHIQGGIKVWGGIWAEKEKPTIPARAAPTHYRQWLCETSGDFSLPDRAVHSHLLKQEGHQGFLSGIF